MQRVIWILVVFTLISSKVLAAQTDAGDLPVEMKLFYHDFKMITYGAITSQNVEVLPDAEFWFYGKNSMIKKIVEQVKKHPKKVHFDNNNVRLKLNFVRSATAVTYLVDRFGSVLRSPDNATFQMAVKEQDALHNQIVQLKGIVDKRPNATPW